MSETSKQETSDINLATYIKVVKGIPTTGHYFKGNQLCITFDISPTDLEIFQAEYLNSTFADYDGAKRNFMKLLRQSRP